MKKAVERKENLIWCMVLLLIMLLSVDVSAASKKKPGKTVLSKITVQSQTSTKISWKKTENATHYYIYYKKQGSKKWVTLKKVKAKNLSFVHKSSKKYPLVPGKTYYYTVKAYNSKSKKKGSYNKKGLAVTIPKKISRPKQQKPTASSTVPKPEKTETTQTQTVPVKAPEKNTVECQGVTFNMDFFPKTLTVGKNTACLSVRPLSSIDPKDITYKIGDSHMLADENTPNLYRSPIANSDLYKREYYISDWRQMTAYVTTFYSSIMYLKYRVEIYCQLRCGSFPVSVYYKNQLIRTCIVTVNETDATTLKWRNWVNEIEANAWTGTMTKEEKLSAIEDYVRDHYTYEEGYWCNHGAAALLYAARDLGLNARYRFVGENYDYERGQGDIYYHNGMAGCIGHVCTVVNINGKDRIYETQGR